MVKMIRHMNAELTEGCFRLVVVSWPGGSNRGARSSSVGCAGCRGAILTFGH